MDIQLGNAGKSTPSFNGGRSPEICARMFAATDGVDGAGGAGDVRSNVRIRSRKSGSIVSPLSPS